MVGLTTAEERENTGGQPPEVLQSSIANRKSSIPDPRAWISRYAWGRDYHAIMRARLERLRSAIEELTPGVETRVYVDTGPIVERAFARLSGIGWMGKNTCLINQQKGSWFFIGVVLTSLELEPDRPAFDRCGSCRRCLDACPTGALVEPYVMDASRCISYLNIELRGSIPAEFRPAVGANLFGCDICQDVCPWNGGSGRGAWGSGEGTAFAVCASLSSAENGSSKIETRKSEFGNVKTRRRAATTQIPQFYPLTINRIDGLRTTNNGQQTADDKQQTTNNEPQTFSLFHPQLEDLASLTEDDFRRIFRDSPIKRVKYRGWLRNLCVVAGNSGDPRLLSWLERMRFHEDAVVREHAEWAIQRMAES
jgi:epoxyqueuosine reductase QueG